MLAIYFMYAAEILLKFERLNKRFILYMPKLVTDDLSVVKGKSFKYYKIKDLFIQKICFALGYNIYKR